MSLFPAYNSEKSEEPSNVEKPQESSSWLTNQSYKRDGQVGRASSHSSSTRTSSSSRSRRSRSRSGSRRSKRSRRSRSKKRHKKEKKKRRHEEEKKPPPSREELIAKHSRHKTFLEDVGLQPEYAFREDRDGDKYNLKVDEMPAYRTAHYKQRWKYDILSNSSSGTTKSVFAKTKREPLSRYYGKDYLKRFSKAEQKQEVVTMMSNLNRQESYVAGPYIRFIHEEAKVKLSAETDIDCYDFDDIRLHQVQQKTRHFNQSLRLNPDNEQLWLDYVDFQDVAMAESEFDLKKPEEEKGEEAEKASKRSSRKKTKAGSAMLRSKAIVEKKLAILKSALDSNPRSIALAVKRLQLSKEILDSDTLDRQWKELIFLFPGNLQVWDHYLAFLTSHFTTFTVGKLGKAFKTCLAKLKEMHGEAFGRHGVADLENQMTNVLVRVCHLWQKAGFRERGVALFQALIELNLFSPPFPGYYSLDDRLAMFEPFWESGTARFGEPGVLGWAAVMKNKDQGVLPIQVRPVGNTNDEEDECVRKFGSQVDEAQLWLRLELAREDRHWCPWRANDEEEEDEPDDPDRSVLYDHLDGLLFQFVNPVQVFKLLLCFLDFLGVESAKEDQYDMGCLSTHTFNEWLGTIHCESTSVDIGHSLLLKTSPDLNTNQDYQAFVRNVFSQSTKVLQDPFKTQMVLLWLRFETSLVNCSNFEDIKSAKKAKAKEIKGLAKTLLEQDQKNTLVYIGYARALEKLEGYKSANKVIQMALASSKSDTYLYMQAITLELNAFQSVNDDHHDNILWLLILLANNWPYQAKPQNKTDILSAAHEALITSSQALNEALNEPCHNSGPDPKAAPVLWHSPLLVAAFSCAWLNYFVEDSSVSSQLLGDAINKAACKQSSRSTLLDIMLENLHKIRIDLLLFAANSHNGALRLARVAISNAVKEFPCNQYILNSVLLDILDVRTTVSSEMWRNLTTHLSSKKIQSPSGQICLVRLLVAKFVQHNSTVTDDDDTSSVAVGYLYKALALLNDFVKRDPCRHAPVVWRLLMWVTQMLSRLQPKKFPPTSAKTVFYRALQDNPSAKVLGLDLVNYCHQNDAGSNVQAELQDIFAEKEVRVRMPIEELRVLLEPE